MVEGAITREEAFIRINTVYVQVEGDHPKEKPSNFLKIKQLGFTMQ